MADIEKLDVYKEQYAHFRAMNDILYKMPPIFTTILGGLWYFAVSEIDKDKWLATAVFIFSAVASGCFVNVLHRFRLAFNAYIDNLNKMDGEMKVSLKPTSMPSTITTTQLLLWLALLMSVAGAIYSVHH